MMLDMYAFLEPRHGTQNFSSCPQNLLLRKKEYTANRKHYQRAGNITALGGEQVYIYMKL